MSTSTKTGTSPFCRIGLTVVGNPAAHGDDLVAGAQRLVAEQRAGQRGDREQVGRRAGVAGERVARAEEPRERSFERVVEAAGGQPEVERGVDQRDRVRGSPIDLAGDGNREDPARTPARMASAA